MVDTKFSLEPLSRATMPAPHFSVFPRTFHRFLADWSKNLGKQHGSKPTMFLVGLAPLKSKRHHKGFISGGL